MLTVNNFKGDLFISSLLTDYKLLKVVIQKALQHKQRLLFHVLWQHLICFVDEMPWIILEAIHLFTEQSPLTERAGIKHSVLKALKLSENCYAIFSVMLQIKEVGL